MICLGLIVAACIGFYSLFYVKWDYKKKFTFKTVMIYLSIGMVAFNLWLVATYVVDAVDEIRYDMPEERLDRVRRSQQEGDYNRVLNQLILYEDFEPEFEYLWERMLMYTYYNRYCLFARAEAAGLQGEYGELTASYRQKLEALCTAPKYSENIPYGEDFLERATAVGQQ